MKRILLGIFALTVMGSANAQIEIQVGGTGADVSGTILDYNVDQFTTTPYEVELYVTNSTGANEQWQITRVKQNVPSTWSDQVCWPPSCFPASGDVYATPNTPGNPAPIIANGTATTTDGQPAVIKPLITPDGANNIALYMYYITSGDGNYQDSVGVRYNFALGVDENTPSMSVSVSPNPANSYVNVQTTGVENGTIKVLDVLGNVVLKQKISGSSKTINTDNFRNGIYFVRVEAEGVRTVNRKVIVRH